MTPTVDFPHPVRLNGPEPILHLTAEVAGRLRGRFPAAADLVGAEDTMRVDGVQLLGTGWIRAHAWYDHRDGMRARVDLLLPPGAVTAVVAEAISRETDDRLLNVRIREAFEALNAGWQASAGEPIARSSGDERTSP